ncbi:type II toxin-antitoxin system HipA family toxin [uncultured Paludibaculum sp.]|uniref:type II toxin-antitoxin system HipA family toxin n=1 Tax=uncultured Paludibaculum sp. TaxID=1765020 RepID=UPI002AAB604E|nr:type II toxin-antitoxin system HipA family toxin [uncultured Paludibaculum sp.]
MPRASGLVAVYADLDHCPQPLRMGTLRRQSGRGGDVFSFEYERDWLNSPVVFSFDPDLALVQGPQYPAARRANFGIFLDSAPDRWGRILMQRRESIRASREGRAVRSLTDWDFLLGVHDETRLGALRFQDPGSGQWLDTDTALAAPPITALRDLQAASLHFEQSVEDDDHGDQESWLAQLFAPGSSLGGARPKASIRDEEGALCIAKFPSRQDRRDVGAWELVAHRLAEKAGISVPPARALRVQESAYTTFVARRFDRTSSGRRLAFVSAMTLTQRTDGEPGASYLELVDLLQSRGAHAESDCRKLFRRVVFSILIHNTDDHLRNHGFILSPQGIALSPAFDMNPAIDRNELALAINEVDSTCDVAVALEAHADYGLTATEARTIISKTRAVVASWRTEASRLRIPKTEQELMAKAFAG